HGHHLADGSPYKKRFRSEFAGILQEKIRQRVAGDRMFMRILCEGEQAVVLDARPRTISAWQETPTIPYTWQEAGEVIELSSMRHGRIKVLGCLNPITTFLIDIRVATRDAAPGEPASQPETA